MESSYNEKFSRKWVDSITYAQMQALQVELERVQKENQTLRIVLEIVSSKFISLQAEVQETKAQQMMTNLTQNNDTFHDGVYDTNKRARLRVPVIRPKQIIVRTDSKDKSPVQRCVEDESLLVATYEGEHNHDPMNSIGQSLPSPAGGSAGSSIPYIHCPVSTTTSSLSQEAVPIGLTLSSPSQEKRKMAESSTVDYSNKSCSKIEDYVASLTRDPEFTVALATAVARSMTL